MSDTYETDPVQRALTEWGGGDWPEAPLTFIYFIQAVEEGGPIKIGRSLQDPWMRLSTLQSGNPFRLGFTRLIVAHWEEETRLHAVFADFRLAGEWFRPHPTLATVADAKPDPSIERGVHPRARFVPEAEAKMRERAIYHAQVERFERRLPICNRERTLTYRPTPDIAGWKNSSADVSPLLPGDDEHDEHVAEVFRLQRGVL